LRGYGDILRGRNPTLAAQCYAKALEYPPQLHYSKASTLVNKQRTLDILRIYRNFQLSKLDREYIAAPINIGVIDVSLRSLRSPSHRLCGLLLMRVRAWWRARLERKSNNPIDRSAGDNEVYEIANVAHVHDTGVPSGRLASDVAPASARQRSGSLLRVYALELIKWKKRLARFVILRSIGIVSRHASTFQFILLDSSEEELMRQIDDVHKLWLSPFVR
jgi:hypothetical protein